MSKHDIQTYSKLAEGAKFFLDQSFKSIDDALQSEVAGEILTELILQIEPSEEDRAIFNNAKIPENVVELLQSGKFTLLSEATIFKFQLVWKHANEEAKSRKHIFKLDHKIETIELLGHLNNLGFFLETLTNRHLLFLHHSDLVDQFSYQRISIAKIMERLIFIFKDDLTNNKLHLNEISNLFSLRNKTVHYTPDNAIALQPKISELIQIWTQLKKTVEKFEQREKINEPLFSIQINHYIESFKERWTK